MKQTREVVIHLKLALTIRVETETADEAEDQANAIADASVAAVGFTPGVVQVTELDRLVNRVNRVAPGRPVRTVMVSRDIGGGCVNDEGADV